MIVHGTPDAGHDDVSGTARRSYPCSQAQIRFWIEEQLWPRNPALNVAVRWRLDGRVSHAVLSEAWRRIIHRHEPLRTSLVIVDGDPVQLVEPQVALEIPVVDLRSLGTHAALAHADRLAEDEAQRPFDIARAPLIRVTQLIISDTSTMLLVTAHHAICDGWSIGILAREMGQLCAALTAGVAPFLPELACSFGEYAQWERDELAANPLDAERAHVATMLRGYKQFELMPDHPRPPRLTSHGAIASILLDRALTDALAQLSRSNGCTLFMTSLAALFVLFHRYTGETDIVVGTQVVGRDDEELVKLVGCFINTIALRADLSDAPEFLTLLDRVRDMVSDTFDVRALPLQQLVEIAQPVRDPSRNALFSVNFIFQRSFIANESYGTFALVDLPSRSAGALYDINMFMVERPEGWRVSCEYNTALFERATIDGLLERFVNLLRAVVADPTQPIGELELLGEADRSALVVDANATQSAYPATQTLTNLVAAQVARTPDAVALVCGERSLTFAELAAAAEHLAIELTRRGVRPGERIGILLDRSPELVIALLAVLDIGCAYVPLDPNFPAERLAFIAADAELAATITRRAIADRFAFTGEHTIVLDELPAAAARAADAVAPRFGTRALVPEQVAYVIYTSGSTGQPKGVQITHRSLVNFLWSMRGRPGLTAADTLVAVTTISFDIAGLEMFLPLITGARLVIATETDVPDGAALWRLMRRTRATVLQATPVTWQLLIDAGWHGDPAVRMLCGGEALSRPLAEQLLDRGAELWNMYGPTETTIWSAVGQVTRGAGPVLVGDPIANTQLYVLDANGQLVPPGVPGELYIGGAGVAAGYFKRDALTRERFVPDRFTAGAATGGRLYRTGDVVRRRNGGGIEFLGRTDHQVKVRGFRIELDEIAAVLLRQPGVADAVVISVPDALGEASLRAYVVAQDDVDVPVERWPLALREQIARILPNYMLPSAIVVLAELPRTPNGKIDRAALPLAQAASVVPPSPAELAQTPTEMVVAGFAQELLGRESVGRNEDLFTLGFHSLLAVRFVAKLAAGVGTRLALRAVFDHPTVAGVAALIDEASARTTPEAAPGAAPIVVYHGDAAGPPLIFFHSDAQAEGMYCRKLSAAIGRDVRFVAMAPHGSAGLPVMPSMEAMARDYVARIKQIEPVGPYRIGGHCVGGIVAYAVARLLRERGDEVERLILVNSYAPQRLQLPGVDWIQRRVGLDARLGWRLREKICLNLVRFTECVDRGPAAVLRFIRARIATVTKLRERELQNALAHPEIFEREPGAPETEAYFAYTIAGFTYHPAPPYTGPLTLVLSDNEDVSMGDPNAGDPTIGWRKLATDIRLVPFSGGHNSPVQERVGELGVIIAQALDS